MKVVRSSRNASFRNVRVCKFTFILLVFWQPWPRLFFRPRGAVLDRAYTPPKYLKGFALVGRERCFGASNRFFLRIEHPVDSVHESACRTRITLKRLSH